MGDITIYSKLKKTVFSVLLLVLIVFPVISQDNSQGEQQSVETIQETDIRLSEVTNTYTAFDETTVPITESSGSGNTAWVFIRMILVLALVLGIIYFLFWLIKRKSNPTGDEDPFLRRVSAVSMGQGKSVQIITLVDKAYIVGVSENNVNLIDRVEDEELVNAMNLYADKNQKVKRPKSFEEVLNIFMPSSGKKNTPSEGIYDGSTQQVLDMLKKQSDRLGDGE